MISRTLPVLSFGLTLLLLTACAGRARVVRADLEGGEVALEGRRDLAYEDARRHMADHCGGASYQIIRQEEAVVGSDRRFDRDALGARSKTRDVREQRLTYVCGDRGGPPGTLLTPGEASRPVEPSSRTVAQPSTTPGPDMPVRLNTTANHQLRVFPVPFWVEFDQRIASGSWVGLQLNVGPAMPASVPLGSGTVDLSGAFVYRWQTPTQHDLGAGVVGGVGVGALAGSVPWLPSQRWVGVQLLAGAELRWRWLSLGVDALYLTPVTFNGNNDPMYAELPWLVRPRLTTVFSF